MALESKAIARNLDEPARILGLSPLEFATCAIVYAISSPVLKGIPFSALISLGIGIGAAGTLAILNRTYPPNHGLFFILQLFRPKVVSVQHFGLDGDVC